MPKPRQRTQLTVQVPDPALLARLRALAEQRRQTLSVLVVEALEALLAGAPAAPADDDLARRVEALERRVRALEQPPAPAGRLVASGPAVDLPAGVVTTADLADRLGMRRHALNERLRRMGGACVGLELNGWRCIGQRPSPTGGPPRWCWEPVEASPA